MVNLLWPDRPERCTNGTGSSAKLLLKKSNQQIFSRRIFHSEHIQMLDP